MLKSKGKNPSLWEHPSIRKAKNIGGNKMSVMMPSRTVEIERKRAEMIQVGMAKGFSDTETIKLSQELDKLILVQMKSKD
jgi:uncharacterized protein YoaH (UPF0181 family)